MAKKIIVAYYSRGGENYVGGTIKRLSVGNTAVAARCIANITGAELFEIRQKKPYSDIYNECTAEAGEDQKKSARPELTEKVGDITDTDVVFLGYPNYWGTMPMAVFTFLESADFGGKTIIPFCTSGGSGISTSVSAIRSLCPDSEVKDGFRGSRSTDAEDIAKWFDDEGLKKADESAEAVRVKLTWDGGEAVLALVSNKTTEDFVSRLPFTLTMEDYAGTEKIGRFSEALYKDTDVSGLTPTVGTAAIYAPWGNLAVFYGSASYSKDLIPVGSIESGLDALSSENDNFEVTFTLLESAK